MLFRLRQSGRQWVPVFAYLSLKEFGLDPVAVFRLSVLGPVVSRQQLARGELKALLCELAAKEYDIPGSPRRHIAEKTLQQWLTNYRRHGLAGLSPKQRRDQGLSKL